jgi:hypothetical protein
MQQEEWNEEWNRNIQEVARKMLSAVVDEEDNNCVMIAAINVAGYIISMNPNAKKAEIKKAMKLLHWYVQAWEQAHELDKMPIM